MALNLVDIQESVKPIANPFGFTFVCKYGNKKFGLKPTAPGEWLHWIGELRDHFARHLYMKIAYQYHDEQVRKLKSEGKLQEARGFRISAEEENFIYRLITGEDHPKHRGTQTASDEEVAADLTELTKQMSQLDRSSLNAVSSGKLSSVSSIIAKARETALNDADVKTKVTDGNGSAHKAGVVGVEFQQESQEVHDPGSFQPVAATAPQEVTTDATNDSAFDGVQEQLNNG